MTGPLRIFLVAAEESGDRLGSALMQALRERTRQDVQFQGVGGNGMAANGLPSLFPIDELSIMGFNAIPRRLPVILRRIRETAQAVLAAKPDALVIIDSPDFTHRVARKVRAADSSIPIVNYVPPTVWAWRPGRARAMRRYVDHAMALLPFEPTVHHELGGPPCTYVGHPLSEQIGTLRPNPDEARRRLSDPPIVLLLPGSRGTELRWMAGDFGAAAARLRERVGEIDVVLPTVPALLDQVTAATATWPVRPRIVTDIAEKHAAYRAARVALAKSGTVTLELALAGVPMVTAYKGAAFEAWVAKRLVRVSSIILANLVIGENVVPEFIQGDCTADRLATALAPLMVDTPERRRQLEAFARLDSIMEIGSRAPAARAADVVFAAISRPAVPFAGAAPKL